MNEKSLRVLEWLKVRELVAERTNFSLSRELMGQLQPSTDFNEVVSSLTLTSEGVRLLWKHGEPPFGGASEIRAVVGRARLGGVLDPLQLLAVADLLYCVGQLKRYLAEEEGPLAEFHQRLQPEERMREEIVGCLDHAGSVRDWATQEMGRIRSKTRMLASRLKEPLVNLILPPAMQKALQDCIMSVQSGRDVVPVKSEFRSKLQG